MSDPTPEAKRAAERIGKLLSDPCAGDSAAPSFDSIIQSAIDAATADLHKEFISVVKERDEARGVNGAVIKQQDVLLSAVAEYRTALTQAEKAHDAAIEALKCEQEARDELVAAVQSVVNAFHRDYKEKRPLIWWEQVRDDHPIALGITMGEYRAITTLLARIDGRKT